MQAHECESRGRCQVFRVLAILAANLHFRTRVRIWRVPADAGRSS